MTNFLSYSRKKWRNAGYYVEGTEQIRRLPGGRTSRKDLLGFADLLAVPDPRSENGGPWVLLQVTSWGHVSTRLRKIQQEVNGKGKHAIRMCDLARAVLRDGHRVVIEGWKQENGPGTKWISRERELTMEDL